MKTALIGLLSFVSLNAFAAGSSDAKAACFAYVEQAALSYSGLTIFSEPSISCSEVSYPESGDFICLATADRGEKVVRVDVRLRVGNYEDCKIDAMVKQTL